MKAYALGIIAVLFLSVGYSAFRNAEANRDEALAIARDVPTFNLTPTFSRPEAEFYEGEIPETDLALETGEHEGSSSNASQARVVKINAAAPAPRARRRAKFSKKSVKAPVFSDTIIYYKEPDRSLLADTRSSAVLACREERRKNRSLLSKTFSVVKKPYDWVKTAVSKMD